MQGAYRDREQRNATVRRHRRAQKGDLSVYGVWFPAAQVLKVGFASHRNNSIFVAYVRNRARNHAVDPTGAACIWKRPGDLRTESWVQATLAFRWRPAFRQTAGHLCEWFHVPLLSAEETMLVLDNVYASVPDDLVGRDVLAPDAVPPILSPPTLAHAQTLF